MLRTTEGDIAAPEFLPKGLDVMGLVRQLMLPSAETVEKLSYGDPFFRMPTQSNIPITADKEYLADVVGMIPFGAPAARPTARGIQDLVRQIQTEPPTGAISSEIAARVLPETKVASETNQPIVAYHATGKEINQLDPAMASGKSAGTGTFFSSNPYTASTYALGESPNVIPAYLDFKRPMVVDAQGANWNRLNKKAKVDLPDAKQTTLGRIFGDELRYVDDYASTDDLARYAKQQGYDGLVVRNVVDHGPAGRFSTDEALEPSDIYVAFDKQNIRSALSDEQMAGLLDEPAQSVVEAPKFEIPSFAALRPETEGDIDQIYDFVEQQAKKAGYRVKSGASNISGSRYLTITEDLPDDDIRDIELRISDHGDRHPFSDATEGKISIDPSRGGTDLEAALYELQEKGFNLLR
jgi:hypothetical protein